MLSDKTQNAISLFCYVTVSNAFAAMHNPRYRGDKFTWEGFPDMMEGQCGCQVHLSVLYPEKQKEKVKEHAALTGKRIAQELVKVMEEDPSDPS